METLLLIKIGTDENIKVIKHEKNKTVNGKKPFIPNMLLNGILIKFDISKMLVSK